jgi:magnesium-protoporphyrin IX monomethyl ester (oxidative) cyclase
LETSAFFVVGLPGESSIHLKNTFRFAEQLNADNINFFFATPLHGTRLSKLCKERGLINDSLDYTKLKSDCPNFSTEDFSVNDLRHIIFHEQLKIYLFYLSRNPWKFLYRIYNKILKDHAYFLRFAVKYLRENPFYK